MIWKRLGPVRSYIEPFAGSLAVMLRNPYPVPRYEVVNDLDNYVANAWRSIAWYPEAVAFHADWPVNEACLTARHRWLMVKARKDKFRKRMLADPFYYDAMIAGWWVWGQSCWIGAGWCDAKSEWHGYATEANRGRGMQGDKTMRSGLGKHDEGVCCTGLGIRPGLAESKSVTATPEFMASSNRGTVKVGRPHLGRPYQVCTVPEKRGNLARLYGSTQTSAQNGALADWMRALAARLRYVRTCCGDWKRVVGKAVLTAASPCGVVLDPPYSAEAGRDMGIYSQDCGAVAHEVRAWCVEHGADPSLRIALCGYEGEGHEELEALGWTVVAWKASGGYGRLHGDKGGRSLENRHRERVWFSPHCAPRAGDMPADAPLFAAKGEGDA